MLKFVLQSFNILIDADRTNYLEALLTTYTIVFFHVQENIAKLKQDLLRLKTILWYTSVHGLDIAKDLFSDITCKLSFHILKEFHKINYKINSKKCTFGKATLVLRTINAGKL